MDTRDRPNSTPDPLTSQGLDKCQVLEAALAALPGLISYMDRDLKYLYVNQAYEDWFGVSREQCLRSTMREVVGDAAVKAVQSYLDAAYHGIQQEFECKVPYRRGGQKTVHVKYLPDKGPNGITRGIIVIVNNITHESGTEHVLQEKRARIDALFNQSADAIMTLAPPSWKFTGCNPAALKLFEVTSEAEFIQLGPWDLSPELQPDGRPSSKSAPEVIMRAIKTGSESFAWEHQTKRGHKISCNVLLSRVSLGEESYLQATVRDVTAQKASEAETHAILETMADGLVIHGESGVIEKINPSALTLLDLTEDELLGRSSKDPRWHAVNVDGTPYPGDQHPAMIALKTGQSIKGALMGLNLKDGSRRWIKINAVPFKGSSGRRVVCTFSDVTELLDTQTEIRFVLDSLKIGVWKFNPVTQALQWDQSMYALFDVDRSDFMGDFQAWESTLTPESKAKAVEELGQALRGEKEFDTVFEIETKSRGRRYISGRGTVIRDANKQPILMYGINADVTEETKLRQELTLERVKSVRAAKLASLGEVSAGVAHEINNPLAIISGTIGLLPKFVSDPEKFNSKINTLQKSCDRIARIVAGLRKFSRSGDRVEFHIKSLADIVRESLVLIESKSKRHATPVDLIATTEATVWCDEIEVEQVLVNLINNAIDAVKDQSERWIKVSLTEVGDELILTLTDSGHGIPEAVRNRLFEPFFTTKKVGEGTGLGLSIAKGILDEHHATIRVVPESPNTCFEIRFPKSTDKNKRSSAA